MPAEMQSNGSDKNINTTTRPGIVARSERTYKVNYPRGLVCQPEPAIRMSARMSPATQLAQCSAPKGFSMVIISNFPVFESFSEELTGDLRYCGRWLRSGGNGTLNSAAFSHQL